LVAWAEEEVQDWKVMGHELVQEADCSTWQTFQHPRREVGLRIWAAVVLLVGMVLSVVLALGMVQFLQRISELAEALAELLVHVLLEHFEGFLTVSSTWQVEVGGAL
jgi:hypothetical protein